MVTFVKKNIFSFFAFLLAITTYAQISISKPTFVWNQICANPSYNTYEISFTFSPTSGLNPSNQFIAELSDAQGNFTNPTILITSSAGSITTSPATLNFSVPSTTAGENYKLRVRSTSPAYTSANSNSFAAYYKIQDSPFTINNFVSTASYCSGGSYVLNIDNPGTGSNDSPLKYPSLTFNWFKEPSLTPIATGPSLTVTQTGVYYAETNYGTCTSDSYSNRVTVTEGSNQSAVISSSLGNPFCSDGEPTILSVQSGNNFQWYKNNQPISGANSSSYQTIEEGNYSINVDFGGCSSTGSIDLQKVQFTGYIDNSDPSTIAEGETITITTTTDAVNPSYQWYLNDNLITGAEQSTFDATQAGTYKVIITQNSDCVTSNENTLRINQLFDPNAVAIPNFISPNNDGTNDTWVLPQEYVSGTETEIIIMSSSGEVVFKTNNYLNNWPENALDFKSINPVYYYIISPKNGKVKKGSITVVK